MHKNFNLRKVLILPSKVNLWSKIDGKQEQEKLRSKGNEKRFVWGWVRDREQGKERESCEGERQKDTFFFPGRLTGSLFFLVVIEHCEGFYARLEGGAGQADRSGLLF